MTREQRKRELQEELEKINKEEKEEEERLRLAYEELIYKHIHVLLEFAPCHNYTSCSDINCKNYTKCLRCALIDARNHRFWPEGCKLELRLMQC